MSLMEMLVGSNAELHLVLVLVSRQLRIVGLDSLTDTMRHHHLRLVQVAPCKQRVLVSYNCIRWRCGRILIGNLRHLRSQEISTDRWQVLLLIVGKVVRWDVDLVVGQFLRIILLNLDILMIVTRLLPQSARRLLMSGKTGALECLQSRSAIITILPLPHPIRIQQLIYLLVYHLVDQVIMVDGQLCDVTHV